MAFASPLDCASALRIRHHGWRLDPKLIHRHGYADLSERVAALKAQAQLVVNQSTESEAFEAWWVKGGTRSKLESWNAWQARAALAQQPSAQDQKCRTCGGTGWIGGPSYYAPDEGGEPCPDCDDREDAARYRFIRDDEQNVWCSSGDDLLTGEGLDAAIDAARAAKGE